MTAPVSAVVVGILVTSVLAVVVADLDGLDLSALANPALRDSSRPAICITCSTATSSVESEGKEEEEEDDNGACCSGCSCGSVSSAKSDPQRQQPFHDMCNIFNSNESRMIVVMGIVVVVVVVVVVARIVVMVVVGRW